MLHEMNVLWYDEFLLIFGRLLIYVNVFGYDEFFFIFGRHNLCEFIWIWWVLLHFLKTYNLCDDWCVLFSSSMKGQKHDTNYM